MYPIYTCAMASNDRSMTNNRSETGGKYEYGGSTGSKVDWYSTGGPRGVTARTLFAKSHRPIVNEIVQEQVRVIDAVIVTNHGAGFNSVVHDLPVTFNIAGMDKADSQALIYSEILSTYKRPEPEGKGFDNVYIEHGEYPKIHIKWVNGMDEVERQQRMSYIKSCYLPDARRK